jgi:hypothetical protein
MGPETVRINNVKQERTYVAWLAGSIVGGLVLVGGVAAADVEKGTLERAKHGKAVASADIAPTCDIEAADGETVRGNLYDDLCLVSPPAGWIAPAEKKALRFLPRARLVTMNLDSQPCTADPAAASLEQA